MLVLQRVNLKVSFRFGTTNNNNIVYSLESTGSDPSVSWRLIFSYRIYSPVLRAMIILYLGSRYLPRLQTATRKIVRIKSTVGEATSRIVARMSWRTTSRQTA